MTMNCVLNLMCLACMVFVAFACQPPDVPVGGSFTPLKKKYLVGDKVTYNCKNDSLRIGKEMRTCEFNGKWSDQTPFCDSPAGLKNPEASSVMFTSQNAQKAVDGDITKCFMSKKGTGENFKIYLVEPAVINLVRMYLPKGAVKLEVYSTRTKIQRKCTHFERELEENQWVLLECEDNQVSDYISIRETSASQKILEICELEIYVKEDSWCRDPPDVFVPNGRLEVSREKSTLQCAESYRPVDNVRIVCDKNTQKWVGILQCEEILCNLIHLNETSGGEWRIIDKNNRLSVGTSKRLFCEQGYEISGQPDTVKCLIDGAWSKTTANCIKLKIEKGSSGIKKTIIAVSVVVVLVIVASSGLLLFFILKKKSEPNVVIVKSDDNIYTVHASGSGTVTYGEAEYSTITYDATTFKSPSPNLPVTKPPVNLLEKHINIDQWSLMDNSELQQVQPHAEPKESFKMTENKVGPDIVFDNLKFSSLYGT